MHHKYILRWLMIATVAILILLGAAYSIQKPQALRTIGLFTPSPTPTPVASTNIIVISPTIGEYITQHLRIKGKARVFENIVWVRLRNKLTGKIYGQTTLQTDSQEMGQFGNFDAIIEVTDQSLKPGIELLLDVYHLSPKDGREQDTVTIPMVFSPTAD